MSSDTLKISLILGVTTWTAFAYNVEFIDVNVSTTTPDLVDVYAKRVVISRGLYGFSAFLHLKEDINTDLLQYATKVYYSTNGYEYNLTPYHIGPKTITNIINSEYKLYAKVAVEKCCKNIDLPDRFVSPLTARNVTCENCLIETNEYPTAMRVGFYAVENIAFDRPHVYTRIVFKVEKD